MNWRGILARANLEAPGYRETVDEIQLERAQRIEERFQERLKVLEESQYARTGRKLDKTPIGRHLKRREKEVETAVARKIEAMRAVEAMKNAAGRPAVPEVRPGRPESAPATPADPPAAPPKKGQANGRGRE